MRNWHFNHIDFSTYPHYSGDDLGVWWSPQQTLFKIWAPTARQVELRLYENGKEGKPLRVVPLQFLSEGVWSVEIAGNLEGLFYTFRVNDGDWLSEVPDPQARAVGVNGHRGMIFDPAKTNPDGWGTDRGPRYHHFTDWIIYEAHIRDFSISPNSGIHHKGKYLGFTEADTFSPDGETTGLSHLLELGITHVHLLPVFDFYTVDEEHPLDKYNWGYDPQNFNAPEGSYATDPFDGTVRIKELKQLVKTLHDHGIGVIMDVVYNHTGLIKGSVFNQTVPGYFFRQNPDGSFSNASGCGTEIASERSMVRKYMIDSLKYWVQEYHIDGFRFDLMGIYDLETMRRIRHELDHIDPAIGLYGEGWVADRSPMPENQRAVKKNMAQLRGIAAFSDDMRDALKGHHAVKNSKGFVSGLVLREEAVKFGIVAATWHPQIVYSYVESSPQPWAAEPVQCVNYVSCHDNYTLFDKLRISLPKATEEALRRRVKLAAAVILTSQGTPFLHAGEEFCRTKQGHGNSYNAPDAINQLDWSRKSLYPDVFRYFKGLIGLRKNHPVFRLPLAEMVRNNLNFCSRYQLGVVSYCLDGAVAGDAWEQVVVAFNGNSHPVTISLPEGDFRIIVREDEICEDGIGQPLSGEAEVPPVSLLLLAR